MFGRKRKKNVKATALVDVMSPVDLVSPLMVVPPGAPEPAPAPVPEPAPAVSFAPEPAAPQPPAPELTTEPTPASAPPAVAATSEAPAPAGPPPVRYFADEVPTPVFSFSPVGASGDEPETAAVAATPEPGFEPMPKTASGPAAGSRTVALPDSSRALAERMRSSQHEMAQLSMHMDAWMDHAVELRTQLIAEWDGDGLRPSYTDCIVRAVARSLIRNPQLNSIVREQEIELLSRVDVGITTPLDGASPVLVVAGADQRSLKEITAESTRCAAEYDAASPESGPEPTFTVASLGAYGVDAFTPIVLAPNVATLGIGRVRDETRWEGDRPVRASVMTLTLSWDHRALGGAVAAEFLAEVREVLEQPYRLLVD